MADDDDERLRSNLSRLRSSLNGARAAREAEAPKRAEAPASQQGDSGMSLAMRAGSEFISAIIVGAGIGWGLDRLLHTNPAFLIVFFFIGVAAGVWNVIRVTSPKGGGQGHNSPLSSAEAADKGVRRSAPGAGPDAGQERGASGGARGGPNGADDDED